MKLVLSLLLFAFSGGTAYAQTPHVDRIDVPEYGIYTANMDSKVPAPGTATGTRNVVGNVQHEATTRTVPAQLGVHFGFRYSVVGAPDGAAVLLNRVTIFPPPGLRNPANPQPKTRSELDLARRIGEQYYADYSFDNDWEIVPGIWTFQLWYEGRMLAEQTFTVVRQ